MYMRRRLGSGLDPAPEAAAIGFPPFNLVTRSLVTHNADDEYRLYNTIFDWACAKQAINALQARAAMAHAKA